MAIETKTKENCVATMLYLYVVQKYYYQHICILQVTKVCYVIACVFSPLSALSVISYL